MTHTSLDPVKDKDNDISNQDSAKISSGAKPQVCSVTLHGLCHVKKVCSGCLENVVREKFWISLVEQLLLNKHELGRWQKSDLLPRYLLL